MPNNAPVTAVLVFAACVLLGLSLITGSLRPLIPVLGFFAGYCVARMLR